MSQKLMRMVFTAVLVIGGMATATYAHEHGDDHHHVLNKAPHMHVSAPLKPQIGSKLDSGRGCLRPQCECTQATHGSLNCYATRGDCPNHPGLYCIW